MKKITVPTLFILFFSLFIGQSHAQSGYTYTFVNNGSYSFSVSAVPDTSASNFQTSVQSYGFTIIVPDGVTITPTSSFGNGANYTFFNGTDVAQPTIDGYLITETLGSPMNLPAPSAATNTPMVTFQVNGSPTTGSIYILDNNSALANAVTPLKSFMQADMEDDGMAQYANRIDPNGTGTSGTSSYMFNTLSTPTSELVGVSIFPNPATDAITIKGLENNIQSVDVYNITGQKVITTTTNLETVNVSDLANGVYFLKLNAANATKTIKFIKE